MYEVLRRTNGSTAAWRRAPATPRIEHGEPDDPIRVDRPRPAESGPGLTATLRRWTQSVGGRLHFSLTYPLLAGVAIGLIVLVWLAFVTGRRVAERSETQGIAGNNTAKETTVGGVLGLADELGKNPPRERQRPTPEVTREAAKAPEKREVDKSLTPERPTGQTQQIVANPGDVSSENSPKLDARDAKDPKATAKREAAAAPKGSSEVEKAVEPFPIEKGKHYIQIQCFAIDRDVDADHAARFLIDNGVPVAKMVRPKDIVLYVRDTFSITGESAATARAERARAEDWKKRIKALGLRYTREKKGLYDFRFADLEVPAR